jgi:hypothetical protein
MALMSKSGVHHVVLLKLGQKAHLQTLREGTLYMRSISYFAKLEADLARADPYEGVDYIIQPRDVGDFRIESEIPAVGGISVDPSDLAGAVRIAKTQTSSCNLFCMFAVSEAIEKPIFAPGYDWFRADSILLFTNTPQFLERVGRAAEKRGITATGGLIKYFEKDSHSGSIGRFRKDSFYYYQREFRIALEPSSEDPLLLDVGDLSDITSEVIPFDKADEVLDFSSAAAAAAGLS